MAPARPGPVHAKEFDVTYSVKHIYLWKDFFFSFFVTFKLWSKDKTHLFPRSCILSTSLIFRGKKNLIIYLILNPSLPMTFAYPCFLCLTMWSGTPMRKNLKRFSYIARSGQNCLSIHAFFDRKCWVAYSRERILKDSFTLLDQVRTSFALKGAGS